MSFVYANAGSGPSAGGIGWYNFGNLTLKPGDTLTGLSGTLSDGTTVTFDLSAPSTSSMIYDAVGSPSYGTFGYVGYTGVLGNIILLNQRIGSADPSEIVISNIVVKDVDGNPVTNYVALVADAENTNIGESWNFNTDGGPWNLFTTVGFHLPTLTGIGTQSASIIGNSQLFMADYVLSTQAPKNMKFIGISPGGLEGLAIGFATTRVTIQKVIGDRINSNDQFSLTIAGTPSDTAITTGAVAGTQVETATVYGNAGSTYTINEAMAPGSVSTLANYKTVVSAINATPGGTTPPISALPISVTPALGDEIVYTITNAAPETFTKTVDKTFSDKGEILTYTVAIKNPNAFAVPNVTMVDPTPAGTTYVGNLLVSEPYTGTTPATGITITNLPAKTTATISWQVKVNDNMQISQINNTANISIPDGTSGNTNIVTTNVKNADLTSSGNFIKTVDKSNALPNEILTYFLTLKNTGNVPANNVVVSDPAPAGTTLVPGSITSTTPFSAISPSSITLNAPIPANGTTTISYQVKVGPNVPAINPIPNIANVDYTYTVDPNQPNGVKANGQSNLVNTNIINPKVDMTKTVDKGVAYIGQILTYNIIVKNTGNIAIDNALISDFIPNGTSYVPGSLIVDAPYTGMPNSIMLTNSLAVGDSVHITFKVNVTSMPNPNPMVNKATIDYLYTLNPSNPNGASGKSESNDAITLVFRNNYYQQINDLIASVALEEAALAAIANSEGAKIQAAIALNNITPAELLCINKSVQEMLDSISTLEAILKQKLNLVNCQINGDLGC
ncbi:MAG: hypothetical protein RR646_07445 [Erysipelotrichaceae bacterium]